MLQYTIQNLKPEEIQELCARNPVADPSVMETCRAIFEDVSRRGDRALREYTLRFDRVDVEEIRVSPEEFSRARAAVPKHSLEALARAAANIRSFHSLQRLAEDSIEVEPGIRCWRESRAIESVGLYIPGGSAVLPSTVLMLGVPAQLAGCRRVALCIAPRPDGCVSPEVLAAAEMTGIREVFRVGGAQAVAAMALGTATVPKVEKIFGPGNRWVQSAKLLAFLHGVAVDMVAGPSEVLVIADESACADWVAADLVAQAEHGSDSRSILVSNSRRLIENAVQAAARQAEALPRKDLALPALQSSFALEVQTLEQAFQFTNQYAPEHLILHLQRPGDWIDKIQNAGSVFLGPWSPEVAGDYASGTNHTLPTSGLARAFSGVSLDTFVKKITFQDLSPEGLQSLAPTLEILARLEGLEGHRRAVEIRLKQRGESALHAVEADTL